MVATSTADDFKAQGNAAFKENKMGKAIEAYTKALALVEDHIYYSNRSAAYLKSGDAEKALADANACLEMNPDFAKGYSRKGAALQTLKQYDDAMQALQEGLTKFPDNADLAKELERCKTAKAYASCEKQQKARQSVAAMSASESLRSKAETSQGMTDFVTKSKEALELQISALQAQLHLIEALGNMTDEEKATLLFGLIDKDKDGFIDARELANTLCKRNANLALAESLERSISLVAAFDSDHDAKLNLQEFKTFLDSILLSLGVTFHDFSEFLVIQNLFSETEKDPIEDLTFTLINDDINNCIVEEEKLFDELVKPRMLNLFHLFDTDGDGSVDFRDVALKLYQLTSEMEDSARNAITVILMFTKDDTRSLNYEEFNRLMLHVVTAADKKFVEIADDLTVAIVSRKESVSEGDNAKLTSNDELYTSTKNPGEDPTDILATIDALQYGRMHMLFDLWDVDKDGEISFAELLSGMRKFNGSIDMNESVSQAALAMIGFDDEHTQTLSRKEFAKVLVNYAKAAEIDVHALIDFMAIATVVDDDSPEEQFYIQGIAKQATAEIKAVQDMLEGFDIE